jgi:hypothetical protein
LPTVTTVEILPDIVDGPITHAMQRLHPDRAESAA